MNKSGRMVQGKQLLASERNAHSGFRDTCDTDDRWTDDKRQATDEFRSHELFWQNQAEQKHQSI